MIQVNDEINFDFPFNVTKLAELLKLSSLRRFGKANYLDWATHLYQLKGRSLTIIEIQNRGGCQVCIVRPTVGKVIPLKLLEYLLFIQGKDQYKQYSIF